MVTFALVLGASWLAQSAGARAERPHVYAITGATAITAPGRTIEDATIVVRDGLIESVAPAGSVPADAETIEASGRWVFAGWIDAGGPEGFVPRSSSSRASGATAGEGPGPRERPPPPTGPVHPLARVHPEARATEALPPPEGERKREVEKWRELGFTTLLAVPEEGLLGGRAAVVQLAVDVPVAATILREDAAQYATFERGAFGEGYPTSLMGASAAMRQAFHDARRHAEWATRWRSDPRGLRRPDSPAAFEALRPVVRGEQPLFLAVDDPLDALLAHRIGEELGLARLVIVGSGHEHEIAGEIAATGRPLVLPLAFPDEPEVGDAHEALDVSRREMLRYLEAPAGPATLARAGVRVALTARGLDNTGKLHKNLRRMIEAGLDEETALAALTTVPAELLGIERTTGTIEAGKLANLVIADGPPFAEKTRRRTVFVDGIPHEIEVEEKPEGDPHAVVDPRGEWAVTFDLGGRTIERTWSIEGAPGAFGGTAETGEGTVRFDSVTLAGNVLTVVLPARGGRPPLEVTVIVEGEQFEGTAEMGSRTVEVEGERTRGPGGEAR